MVKLRTLALALMLAGVSFGCGDSSAIGPENQLEVTNAADNFQFQVSVLERVSESLSYTWENTGTQATIDISQAITSGSAMLTITDANGAVVYQEDIAEDSDGQSSVGVSGGWGIRVDLGEVTGTFNFRVQRTT